jgi:hypothetical protein
LLDLNFCNNLPVDDIPSSLNPGKMSTTATIANSSSLSTD